MLRLKLSGKLSAGFAIVLLIMAAMSAAVYREVSHVSVATANNAAGSDILNDVDNALESAFQAIIAERGMMLLDDPTLSSTYHRLVATFDKHVAEARTRSTDYDQGIEARERLDALSAAFLAWRHEVMDPIVDGGVSAEAAAKSAAIVRSDRSTALRTAFETGATGLKKRLEALSDDDQKRADAAITELKVVQAVGFVFALLASILVSWLLARAISRPLASMTGAMTSLAAGHLDVAVPVKHRADEIGSMAQAVQVFKEAAIEKRRLEHEAEMAQQATEAERNQREAERAAISAQQAHVVKALATGLERLSEGNLVFRLQDRFAADYEKLRGDFNATMGKLQNTMGIIAGNTSAIRTGTLEISTASDDLSRRTEQQAASLEETAAALDEITATVRKTSEGSVHARKVVADAKADAEHSGGVVDKAVEAMSAIEQSSTKVSQIIGVIDEIAFQTNLLALNAGVEAARAGEAGRGFAVVASEVRALAQRSAEAAKEIKALISTSSQQVSTGVEFVSETGNALKRIMGQVAEINTVVTNIATSTQEQATALQEVNTAINQMDQVTQQNAAMVEESTAASRNLATETEELARLVAQFQVGTGAMSGSAMTRRPAAVARPASRPLTALKTTSQSAAARKPEPQDASWEEF